MYYNNYLSDFFQQSGKFTNILSPSLLLKVKEEKGIMHEWKVSRAPRQIMRYHCQNRLEKKYWVDKILDLNPGLLLHW